MILSEGFEMLLGVCHGTLQYMSAVLSRYESEKLGEAFFSKQSGTAPDKRLCVLMHRDAYFFVCGADYRIDNFAGRKGVIANGFIQNHEARYGCSV